MAQIRTALAAALETALPTTDGQTSDIQLENPSPPTLQVVGVEEVQYDEAMARGLDEFTLVVQGIAGTPFDRTAQTLLDTWKTGFGGTSVKAAIEADLTLGGIVQDVRVTRAGHDSILNLPNRTEARGCEFFVQIMNTGT